MKIFDPTGGRHYSRAYIPQYDYRRGQTQFSQGVPFPHLTSFMASAQGMFSLNSQSSVVTTPQLPSWLWCQVLWSRNIRTMFWGWTP
ncbi:MAG: hypothetical protein BRD23_09310 [Halobacteriales archaeon SW_9_67_25]|nr:MAG: hypothetical protein BRD23_09310 [Halobacteriales archaeon SW_9_67_25]